MGKESLYTQRESLYTYSASKIEGEVGWETTDRQSREGLQCLTARDTPVYTPLAKYEGDTCLRAARVYCLPAAHVH